MYFAEEFDKRMKELGWSEFDDGDIKRYKKTVVLGQTVIVQNNEQRVVPQTTEVVIEYSEGSMYEERNNEEVEVTLYGYSLENGGSEYFLSMDELINSIQKQFK